MTPKVKFRIEQDDGFPPIRAELLNATPLPGGHFRLENAPYFAQGASYHDIVQAAETGLPGVYEFIRVVERSDFIGLSIILLDDAVDARLDAALDGKECIVEYGEFSGYRVVAVAVPPEADYMALKSQLSELEHLDLISLAELRSSPARPVRQGA
jgi:hypothetical protein